jgi:hypothetical protein
VITLEVWLDEGTFCSSARVRVDTASRQVLRELWVRDIAHAEKGQIPTDENREWRLLQSHLKQQYRRLEPKVRYKGLMYIQLYSKNFLEASREEIEITLGEMQRVLKKQLFQLKRISQ